MDHQQYSALAALAPTPVTTLSDTRSHLPLQRPLPHRLPPHHRHYSSFLRSAAPLPPPPPSSPLRYHPSSASAAPIHPFGPSAPLHYHAHIPTSLAYRPLQHLALHQVTAIEQQQQQQQQQNQLNLQNQQDKQDRQRLRQNDYQHQQRQRQRQRQRQHRQQRHPCQETPAAGTQPSIAKVTSEDLIAVAPHHCSNTCQQSQRARPLSAATLEPSRRPAQTLQLEQPVMSGYSTDQPSSDYAELQKLSEQYQAEATGPLVGQLQPSTDIATQYATADPIYRAKTAALPQKYSHYRTVRGDGSCGWRAVGFGYFETLIRHGDSSIFALEEARLRSMDNLIQQAGYDPMLVEDFADETFQLLRNIAAAAATDNADAVLLESFNDEAIQNYVITHFRALTSAWMKTHEDNYAPYLLTHSVEQYCETQITPVAAEMDHVGLSALKDVLLSPARVAMDVVYLDRSEGSEVTMHRFSPASGGGFAIGSLRLLYRPGHYDLIYAPEDVVLSTPAPASVPTYLQYASQSDESVYEISVADFMTSVPGMSYATLPPDGWMSSCYGGGSSLFTGKRSVQSCDSTTPTSPSALPSAPSSAPRLQSQPVYGSASTPSHLIASPTHNLAIPHETAQTGTTDAEHPNQSGYPFRPSAWQLEPDVAAATLQMPYQTSIFRNSHFNTAHFLNPDFQPEQWAPNDEYLTTPNSNNSPTNSKNLRHRNNS